MKGKHKGKMKPKKIIDKKTVTPKVEEDQRSSQYNNHATGQIIILHDAVISVPSPLSAGASSSFITSASIADAVSSK